MSVVLSIGAQGSLGCPLSQRTRSLLALLIFGVVYATFSCSSYGSNEKIMIPPEYSPSSMVYYQRFLREQNISNSNSNQPLHSKEDAKEPIQQQRNLFARPAIFSDPKSVSPKNNIGQINNNNADATNYNEQKQAIFLISFGEAAAAGTLVERSVLSIRRRGAFYGSIVVLTDAPTERYQGVFDESVIILKPNVDDIKLDYFEHGTYSQTKASKVILEPYF